MDKETLRKTEEAKKIAKKAKKTNGVFDGIEGALLRLFRWFSSSIDVIFFSKKYLAIFSLLIAILMYFVVNITDDNLIISTLSSAKTLSGVSITTKYNSELFEISGVPNACSIVITGEASNVNNAAGKDGTCLINLEGYTEGTHKIKMEASGYGDNVSCVVTPTYAEITLKKKTTRQFDLNYQYNNANTIDSKYILGTPVFASGSEKINIRASEDTLNSIETVVAMIDVSGAVSDFTTTAEIVAYKKGTHEKLDVEITPNKIDVTIAVSSPSKEVPISVVFEGNAPSGYSVSSVLLNQQNITIYGKEDVINKITSIPVSIDLSKITTSPENTQAIVLPEGVNSANISMITTKVTLEATVSKVIENVPIVYKNNTKNYGASDIETTTVNVTVLGAESNIANITVNDIEVYIDIADLQPGKYTLNLQSNISSSKYVTLQLSQQTLDITLEER